MDTKLTRQELQLLIARAGHGENKRPLNLSGYDLTGLDLSYLDLSRARFYQCKIDDIKLYYTDLTGAIFEDCYFPAYLPWSDYTTNRTESAILIFNEGSLELELNPIIAQIEALLESSLVEAKDEFNNILGINEDEDEDEDELEDHEPTLRKFPGATVEYWDYKASEYKNYTIPYPDGPEPEPESPKMTLPEFIDRLSKLTEEELQKYFPKEEDEELDEYRERIKRMIDKLRDEMRGSRDKDEPGDED